jgi:hypothetical protein
MSKIKSLSFITALLIAGVSCQTEEITSIKKTVSEETLSQISALGFSNKDVIPVEEGYLVEGDIILTEENLRSGFSGPNLRIAEVEQYSTTELVRNLPRVITVSLSNKISTDYVAVLDEVVRRYNAENLQITLQKVSTGGDIQIVNANGSYLASAGFPSGGNPYGRVNFNTRAVGKGTSTTFINYAATILAHEIGHCIGFRHTDYMNRSFSCGSGGNEGDGGVGAVYIPGTASGPEAGSWMLACIPSNQNRPFNNNDKTALNYLY